MPRPYPNKMITSQTRDDPSVRRQLKAQKGDKAKKRKDKDL